MRAARERKGLNQDVLAGIMGVTPATVNRYEKGHRVPDGEYLNHLVKALDCDPAWLLTGKPSAIVLEEAPVYEKIDPITEKIVLMLKGMPEEKRREVLKYAEEKKQLMECLKLLESRKAK